MIMQRLREKHLAPREKGKVLLLSLILGVVLVGFTLHSAYRYYLSKKDHYQEAHALLQWIDNNRSRFLTSAAPLQPSTGSLLERVSINADQHGISQERIQPQGEHRLQVWLNAVPFEDFITWINALADDGIHVVSVQIDNTVESGKVNVQCQLMDQHP